MQVMERPTVIASNGKLPAAKQVDFIKLVDELHVKICGVWRELE
jgi:hypothetical protein